jgi:ubiquinone/menaquinone biosynthesis C-methylase UbiE
MTPATQNPAHKADTSDETRPDGGRAPRADTPETAPDRVRATVAETYGSLARDVIDRAEAGSCCGPQTCAPEGNPITSDLYDDAQSAAVPADALAELRAGEVVLDLGAGGGIDVLLSARRVGPTGFAYGLDMTDDMVELARRNQREAGVENVEFLKGTIEDVPLPDESADVIISNCVINLSPDKASVFREAHRVLRPGGRLAVSDIVLRGEIDPAIRRNVEAWIGCVAGALEEDEYRAALEAAGFTDVEIEPTRVYRLDDAREFLTAAGIDLDAAKAAEGKVVSAFVRATRP